MKNETIIFPNSKRYRGSISFKKRIKNGRYSVVKCSIGGRSYEITKEEYDWITDRNKAALIYAYNYFGVNASCDIKHPFTGKTALESYIETDHEELNNFEIN